MYLGASPVCARRSSIRRCHDPERINAIANHPAVRPTCGGDGKSELDFTAFLANDKNHAAVWEHGSFLFGWSAPQTYEVHISVLPEGRGRSAYRMAQSGIDYIVSYGAERLWARVQPSFRELRHYVAQAGFTKWETDVVDIGFGPVTYDLYQWKKPCPKH